MKIVQIVPSLEPRHGGPSVSVPNLARGLAEIGNDVSLATTGEVPLRVANNPAFKVTSFPRGWPAAFCPAPGMGRFLQKTHADVFHSHGLWLRTLHHADRAARRGRAIHVISPRGMMSSWAWNHRRVQKMLARFLVHPGAFSRATGWHATSQDEAEEIRSLGFKQPICVASNGVTPPTADEIATATAHWIEACPDAGRRPTALFYSRLHRKKRALELIDLWLQHAPDEWLLLMVGVPEDYTPAKLETYALRASGAGRVRVFDGAGRPPPYPVASLFLLPSHNENFGLVIAEAMAYGLPPLVTDTTPWEILNTTGAGWCVPWERYPAALREALAEGRPRLAERGARAAAEARARYSWERTARELAAFYEKLGGDQGARLPTG